MPTNETLADWSALMPGQLRLYIDRAVAARGRLVDGLPGRDYFISASSAEPRT